MMDIIKALRGKRYCDWCLDYDNMKVGWMDRFMRFDQLIKTADRRWYERWYIKWLTLNDGWGIWKIGRKWHDWRHCA